MARSRTLAFAILLSAGVGDAAAWNFDPPADHGRIVLRQRAQKAGMPPVQFDHWRHRARYTCRACHVDVGFAMEAKATGISAETNRIGFHCGACHDGSTAFASWPCGVTLKCVIVRRSGAPETSTSVRQPHSGPP